MTDDTKKDRVLLEEDLGWAGKLFFASLASYLKNGLVGDTKPPKLPMKISASPEEFEALKTVINASVAFQQELSKPDAKIEDVIEKMQQKQDAKNEFERVTNKKWPL